MPNRFFLLLAVLAGLVLPVHARADGESVGALPKKFLSIDYTSHDTFRGAVTNSFSPTSFKDNVGASIKNTFEPLNPARYVGAVVVVELQKEIASGNGIDLAKVVKKLDPSALAGGYFGAQAGEIIGAAAQTALAKAVGPIGGTMGFALRPILWLAGSSIGGEVGKSFVHGSDGSPVKDGVAKALREFNPVQDSVQMIGDNVGGVIGQALIPVPFVGLMAGAAVGGVTGLLLGRAITQTGPGGALNDYLKKVLRVKADHLSPEKYEEAGKAGGGGVAVPRIDGPITGIASRSVVVSPENKAAADRAYTALQDALKRNDQPEAKKCLEEYRQLTGTH